MYCSRIYDRTSLFVVVKDTYGSPVATYGDPIRSQISNDDTLLTLRVDQLLSSGEYSAYIVTEKGAIKKFSI